MLFQAIKNIKYDNFGETNFITGLRAYAALMVIMIHSGGAGLRELGEVGKHLANLGSTGVYIFFVISGFCIVNSLVGVEWSIMIEIFWYAIIPFLMPLLSNWKKITVFFLATGLIFSAKFVYVLIMSKEAADLAMQWSPLRYAPAFFLGLLAYRTRPWILQKFKHNYLDYLMALGIIAAFLNLIWLKIGNEFLTIIGLSFLILLTGGAGRISKALFENKIALLGGTISYSLYLLHMFFIKALPDFFDTIPFAKFLIVLLLTSVASLITYVLIEQKGAFLGKKLYKNYVR